jgi:NAD-reducing hydrogenase large subunit
VNKNLSIEERDGFPEGHRPDVGMVRGALKIAKDYTVEHLAKLAPFGSFDSNHLSLVREDGAMDLYHGNLRAIDAQGNKIFDQVDYQNYLDYIAEEVRDWSYMKFPFIKSIGRRTAGIAWVRWRASTPATSSTRPRPKPRARSSWR